MRREWESVFAGVATEDVDQVLGELARRGLPADEILSVLKQAAHLQDHGFSYTLPELQADLRRAREIQACAGDPRAITGPEKAEYRAALQRAMAALTEILSDCDDGEGTITLSGDHGEVTQEIHGDNWAWFMAALVVTQATFFVTPIRNTDMDWVRNTDIDEEPFEFVFGPGEDPFRIWVEAGEVKFGGQFRVPKGHRKRAELTGHEGAVARARENIAKAAARRGPVEQMREAVAQMRQAPAPALPMPFVEVLEADILPPSLPTIAAQRPLDAFGRESAAAAKLKRLGVPRALRKRILKLAWLGWRNQPKRTDQ